jgi:uncharacterized membrane protein YedE/YeeE
MEIGSFVAPLLGGALLGGAAGALLLAGGRVAGISGILAGAIAGARERGWRVAFLAGLVVAGVVGGLLAPGAAGASPRPLGLVVVAGLLVGVGTRLGGGCTSGHGVCGLGRLSKRSLAATLTFMGPGALVAVAASKLLGGAS